MNILITTDFLMTSESEQRSNLKWLFDLLARPLSLRKRNQISTLCLPDYPNPNNKFSREDFFKSLNVQLCHTTTQTYFDLSSITEEVLLPIANLLKPYDIIIAYELSEQTRFILNSLSIEYIDIWLHPIRYMEDVLWGVHSNNENINHRLAKYAIDSELFYIYADLLKVQNYKGFRRFKNNLIPNSALFIGQTLMDKAVLYKGKMLNLLDFKDEFKEVSNKYEVIYYSRHPFVKEGDEKILSFLKRFKNVEVSNVPTYHLLASREIDFVFTISSSVAHEAHFFGKETKFLYKPIFHTFDSEISYLPIMHAIFFESFWEYILFGSQIIDSKQLFLGKDKLRDSLAFYWGYRNIDKLESLKQTVSSIIKK